jgi:hypothetical protein
MKRAAIDVVAPPALKGSPPRWKNPDLLAWLEAL